MKKLLASAAIISMATVTFWQAFAATAPDQTVTISTTVQDTLTFSVNSNTVALGNITPGTPVTGTVTATVTTNANSGFNILVKRSDGTGTLANGSTYIPDKTAWDNTASAGAGNSALYATTGLAFRVNKTSTTGADYNATWWGSDDAAGNAKFAGFPSVFAPVYSGATYSATSKNVAIDVKLDVPATQQTLAYSGDIVIRATTNP